MKKIIPVIFIATTCLFTACKKPAFFDEKITSSKTSATVSPQKIPMPCGMREDAAKTAIAKRNATSSQEPIVLLLDFNGYKVNSSYWNGGIPFFCPAVPEELLSATAKTVIMKRVIEDFSAYKVIITRSEEEYRNAPPARRQRCVISQGLTGILGFYGGIAFIGSLTWGDDTPCFVFADNDLYVDKYIADAVSHELGHTFGLLHQSTYNSSCEKVLEYSLGLGSGPLSWTPIMGEAYYTSIGTWHIGPSSADCNEIQNDIEVIKTVAEFKKDDYWSILNDHTEQLPAKGSKKGILENSNDKDAFLKDYIQPKRIKVTSNGNSDVALEVYNLQGHLVAVHDDLSGTNIDVVISGKKYLKVRISNTQPFVPDGDGFGGYAINISNP